MADEMSSTVPYGESRAERASTALERVARAYRHPVQRDYLIASGVGIAAGLATLLVTGETDPIAATNVSFWPMQGAFLATQWTLTRRREGADATTGGTMRNVIEQNLTNLPIVAAYGAIAYFAQAGTTGLGVPAALAFVGTNAASALLTRAPHHAIYTRWQAHKQRRRAAA